MKERAIRKGNGWTTTTLIIVIILSFFMIAGCAEIKLGTLPTPPPNARLRVFVKAISGEIKGRWTTTHESFEEGQYSMAKRYLGSRGYEIVPIDEVHLIAGKEELATWQWSRNDWALAVEVGRRLYAEYVLIVERSFNPTPYLRFLLINVDTKKSYVVMTTLSSSASNEEWRQNYQFSIAKLFNDAHDDLMATVNTKGRAISNELAAAKKEILELTKTHEDGTKNR